MVILKKSELGVRFFQMSLLYSNKVKLTVLSSLLCRRSLLKSLEIRKFLKVYPCLQWCRRPLLDYDFTASGEACFKTLKNCFLGNEISILKGVKKILRG